MFNKALLSQLSRQYRHFFLYLAQCEKNLNNRFVGMEKPIKALILAVASQSPLIFVGPPGTAKSRLIRSFCGLIGLIDLDHPEKDHDEYFEYLLTPFTEPGELFGFYDLAKAAGATPELARMDAHSLQKAQVIYLDEVFNGSSAILNSLLAVMNEGVFHDRGTRSKVDKRLMLGASNSVPTRPELKAFYDRFVLRCFVKNMEQPRAEDVHRMLSKGFIETHIRHKYIPYNPTDARLYANKPSQPFFTALDAFKDSLQLACGDPTLFINHEDSWYQQLTTMIVGVTNLSATEVSNRRLIQIVRIMMVHAIYRIATSKIPDKEPAFCQEELMLFADFFLDHDDEFTRKEALRFIDDDRS